MKEYADLPFASTLCGSCSNVCPVKIDIHQQLYKWRQVLVKEGHVTPAKAASMQAMNTVLSNRRFFEVAGGVGRTMMKWFPGIVSNSLNPWYKHREMPAPPEQSFRDWYAENRK